ncbi:unnamed protein product [Meganyctiphanes norvegica]|uniref:Uncharacterized protein n=1 Tax=Meganyctiphanes norvegica TaxID=48144 RepID=A0AAV2S6L2_MEGNR
MSGIFPSSRLFLIIINSASEIVSLVFIRNLAGIPSGPADELASIFLLHLEYLFIYLYVNQISLLDIVKEFVVQLFLSSITTELRVILVNQQFADFLFIIYIISLYFKRTYFHICFLGSLCSQRRFLAFP